LHAPAARHRRHRRRCRRGRSRDRSLAPRESRRRRLSRGPRPRRAAADGPRARPARADGAARGGAAARGRGARATRPRRRRDAAPPLAASAMLGALRATPAPLPPDHVGRLPLPATARVEARLAADPIAWAPDRARLALDVESVDGVPRSGRISLGLYGPPPPLAEGQRIVVDARLERPVGFRDP